MACSFFLDFRELFFDSCEITDYSLVFQEVKCCNSYESSSAMQRILEQERVLN
jgi:hypothetical protein